MIVLKDYCKQININASSNVQLTADKAAHIREFAAYFVRYVNNIINNRCELQASTSNEHLYLLQVLYICHLVCVFHLFIQTCSIELTT